MFRLVLAALVASAMGFAPSVGVQRTVVRAATPTMQFGGSALDGINEELKKVTQRVSRLVVQAAGRAGILRLEVASCSGTAAYVGSRVGPGGLGPAEKPWSIYPRCFPERRFHSETVSAQPGESRHGRRRLDAC